MKLDIFKSLAVILSWGILLSACGGAGGPTDVYVDPGGNDGNDCLSPATACLSIGVALDRVAGGGTIHFAPGDYLPGAELPVSKVVTLDGAGQDQTFIYSTGRLVNIFRVGRGGWLIARDITFSGERAADGASPRAIQSLSTGLVSITNCTFRNYRGPLSKAVWSSGGTLIVDHSVFDDNTLGIQNSNAGRTRSSISNSSFRYNRTALANDGTLRLADSNLTGNGVHDEADAPGVIINSGAGRLSAVRVGIINNPAGVGILNRDAATSSLSQVEIKWNYADAIGVEGGRLELMDSQIHENAANGIHVSGGSVDISTTIVENNQDYGIQVANPGAGSLTLDRTAVVGNGMSGLYFDSAGNTAQIENSTFAGNGHVVSSEGAHVGITIHAGNLALRDSTVILNDKAGLSVGNGSDSASVTIERSIVMGNTERECIRLGGDIVNHSGSFACAEGQPLYGISSEPSREAGTIVYPLTEGSPMIDTAGAACPDEDQRGYHRIVGGGCDFGAYEYNELGVSSVPLLNAATPSPTPESNPQVIFTESANCRKGPGTRYNVVTSFVKGATADVEGRNADSSWWYVQAPQTEGSCWVADTTVKKQGSPEGTPALTGPNLPDSPEGFDANTACNLDPKHKGYMVNMRWQAVDGATGYRLYRNGQLLASVGGNALNYKDSAPVGGKGFVYEIEAIDANGVSIRIPLNVPACQ
jgi:hypothetical protein